MYVPSNGPVTDTAHAVPHRARFTFGVMICATGTDSSTQARVVAVTPLDGSPQVRVPQFATRDNLLVDHPSGGAIGDTDGTARSLGLNTSGPQYVDPCRQGRKDILAPTELAITVRRVGTGTGTDDGFVITYKNDQGQAGQAWVPWIYNLCAPHDTTTSFCPLPPSS